jgi:TonB-linked SusC/RagA family outer membrane protein
MRKIASLCTVLMFYAALAFGQNRTVTGKVTDDKGDVVPGASVKLKGTRTGVAADIDGQFRISAKTGDVLVISGAGIESVERKLASETTVDIVVKRVAIVNSEVVVTTGLGIAKQSKQLGYSATNVQSKDLVIAKPISVVNGLTGKVAGLQINTVNNGLFAPTRVVLRGNRSLTGNNQPLVVVDGAIFYNDISTLNPDDISDINVLKGSSAAAIYGSDASNGVLIINTKKGTRGKPSLTFSTTAQLETVSYMPSLQNRFGSNGGEAFVNDFNDLSSYIPYENQSYGPEFNGAIVPIGRPIFDGSLYTVPYSALAKEKRNFFDDATTTQNNLSYSSGDENSRFFLSLQDINSHSPMPGDKGRRDVFRVGGTRMYGAFSANYSVSYTHKVTDVTNTANVYQLVMNTPAHIPLTRFKDWRNDKFADPNGFYNDYFDNPYWDIDNERNVTTENDLSGNIQLNFKPTKWLNLSYRLSMSQIGSRYEYRGSARVFSDFAKTDPTVIYSNPNGTGFDTVSEAPKFNATQSSANATYNTSDYSNLLISNDFIASVDKKITKDINLSGSVGMTYIDNKINGMNLSANALLVPVYNIGNVSGTPGYGNFFREARKFGIFGDMTLGFRGYFFLHGNFRTDVDSRLSKSNRFIPYYDIDAALILTDLFPSLADNKVLSFAKIRGAHSSTGNASALGGGSAYIADGAYVVNPVYFPAGGFPYGNLGGYTLSTLIANPDLKPEKVHETEFALELGFLKNRFTFSAAYYYSQLTDGIVTANTASSSGSYNALLNAANVKNKGLELELKSNIVKSKNISWNLNANYTWAHSEVVSINGDVPSLGIPGANGNAFAVVGQPYPVIESRDWIRDAQGHVIVDAVSGNPTRNSQLVPLGKATPTDILGITSVLSWKSLTFTATVDYRGGYKIFNSIGQYMDFTGIASTTAATGRQRFVFPNSVYDDGTGKYVTNTNITTDDANFNFWPGLYRSVGANYVISAAAWKLREVAISWDIPKSVYAGTKIIQKAALTVSGRNLIMLRPDTNKWTDPEFSEDTSNGVGRNGTGQAPPTGIFSATLAVTF